jgi:hypothetical protein
MLEEFEKDRAVGALHVPDILSEDGQEDYPMLFRDAVLNFDEDWLATQLLELVHEQAEEVTSTNGEVAQGISPGVVEAFAKGEFNRLYCRAVCRVAIEGAMARGEEPEVIVYHAEESIRPAPEFAQHKGRRLNAHALLYSLGKSTLDEILDLPQQCRRSALCVCLPRF